MQHDPDGRWLLAHRPRLDLDHVDVPALRALPDGTLGREVVLHLERAGLLRNVELAASPFPMSADAEYARTRWRETHDIRHVLTGLGVGIRDEIVLQAFQLGQFDNRFAKLQMVVGPLLQRVDPVALARDYRRAYEMGRRARPLIHVRWEDLWDRQVDELRVVVGVGRLR
jgi:ubiquinone biosynthesis protein COQ4